MANVRNVGRTAPLAKRCLERSPTQHCDLLRGRNPFVLDGRKASREDRFGHRINGNPRCERGVDCQLPLNQPLYPNEEPEATLKGAAVYVLEKLSVSVPQVLLIVRPNPSAAGLYAAARHRQQKLAEYFEACDRVLL